MDKEILALLECLKWYIEEDDTNIGQPGNEYWEAGKERAEIAVANFEKVFQHGI